MFGPFDNYNLTNSHVIPALIHKTYNAIQNGTSLEFFGTGKPLRQFIYSLDLAHLILWVMREYNVSSYSLIDFIGHFNCLIDL